MAHTDGSKNPEPATQQILPFSGAQQEAFNLMKTPKDQLMIRQKVLEDYLMQETPSLSSEALKAQAEAGLRSGKFVVGGPLTAGERAFLDTLPVKVFADNPPQAYKPGELLPVRADGTVLRDTFRDAVHRNPDSSLNEGHDAHVDGRHKQPAIPYGRVPDMHDTQRIDRAGAMREIMDENWQEAMKAVDGKTIPMMPLRGMGENRSTPEQVEFLDKLRDSFAKHGASDIEKAVFSNVQTQMFALVQDGQPVTVAEIDKMVKAAVVAYDHREGITMDVDVQLQGHASQNEINLKAIEGIARKAGIREK